mmetsp:Transcript_9797/g.26045  ORF Transcript_9797/g.26045 Transcript_9797/m.26045 type:complete len:320 (+) Transcript_9797:228-1187(+)
MRTLSRLSRLCALAPLRSGSGRHRCRHGAARHRVQPNYNRYRLPSRTETQLNARTRSGQVHMSHEVDQLPPAIERMIVVIVVQVSRPPAAVVAIGVPAQTVKAILIVLLTGEAAAHGVCCAEPDLRHPREAHAAVGNKIPKAAVLLLGRGELVSFCGVVLDEAFELSNLAERAKRDGALRRLGAHEEEGRALRHTGDILDGADVRIRLVVVARPPLQEARGNVQLHPDRNPFASLDGGPRFWWLEVVPVRAQEQVFTAVGGGERVLNVVHQEFGRDELVSHQAQQPQRRRLVQRLGLFALSQPHSHRAPDDRLAEHPQL